MRNEKQTLTLENLSPFNAVNRAARGGSSQQSTFLQAVRLLILASQESLIKAMFVQDAEGGSYNERIASGLHQVRLFLNGEQKTISVDDFVPASAFGGMMSPLCAMTATEGELWLALLEKACAKVF